jgi:seryl-tRNA synthetase
MIPIERIREHYEDIKLALQKKHFKQLDLLDDMLSQDDLRKKTQKTLDDILAESNQIAKQIPLLIKEGKQDLVSQIKTRASELKEETHQLQIALKDTISKIEEIAVHIPNIPHQQVVEGRTPEENKIVRSWGDIPKIHEKALPHWDLAKKYDLFDLELGVKLSGAGFPVYKGKGAKLQRALIQFFLDQAELAGYTEIIPPHLVNQASAYATGQLPDKEGQMYYTQDGYFLIPTAEVPVTNILRDTIVNPSELPIKLTAYSPCFRREAGSYGKDVRGLNRVHQFDKVEIVQIQHPEKSYESLEEMTLYVESLLKKLELPYRVLLLCGGDMSFTSAMTYDLEVFSAAQEKWLEVSSVSNFEDYQANRLKVRYKNNDGKNQLCHTLNGSALALPRIVASILENHQTPDGIKIPEALVPYTKFDYIR